MIRKPRPEIDRTYYEESGYFQRGGRHLTDPESPFHRYRIRNVLALCGDLDGRRVVDLGSGWGTLTFALARAGAAEAIGVDFAEESVRIGEGRLAREPQAGIRFLRADAADTKLPGGRWDLVVAADLIEHLDPANTRAVYREARRLLRPGGRLVLWTPNPGHFLERLRAVGVLRPDPTHIDYKTMGRVRAELSSAGFTVVKAQFVASHLPGLRWVERFGQRWVPWLRRRIAVAAVAGSPGAGGSGMVA